MHLIFILCINENELSKVNYLTTTYIENCKHKKQRLIVTLVFCFVCGVFDRQTTSTDHGPSYLAVVNSEPASNRTFYMTARSPPPSKGVQQLQASGVLETLRLRQHCALMANRHGQAPAGTLNLLRRSDRLSGTESENHRGSMFCRNKSLGTWTSILRPWIIPLWRRKCKCWGTTRPPPPRFSSSVEVTWRGSELYRDWPALSSNCTLVPGTSHVQPAWNKGSRFVPSRTCRGFFLSDCFAFPDHSNHAQQPGIGRCKSRSIEGITICWGTASSAASGSTNWRHCTTPCRGADAEADEYFWEYLFYFHAKGCHGTAGTCFHGSRIFRAKYNILLVTLLFGSTRKKNCCKLT